MESAIGRQRRLPSGVGGEKRGGRRRSKALEAVGSEGVLATPAQLLEAYCLIANRGSTPRDLDIPLAFLGPGRYHVQLYVDGPHAAEDAKDVGARDLDLSAADHLKIHLASGGGAAGTFTPTGP